MLFTECKDFRRCFSLLSHKLRSLSVRKLKCFAELLSKTKSRAKSELRVPRFKSRNARRGIYLPWNRIPVPPSVDYRTKATTLRRHLR